MREGSENILRDFVKARGGKLFLKFKNSSQS